MAHSRPASFWGGSGCLIRRPLLFDRSDRSDQRTDRADQADRADRADRADLLFDRSDFTAQKARPIR